MKQFLFWVFLQLVIKCKDKGCIFCGVWHLYAFGSSAKLRKKSFEGWVHSLLASLWPCRSDSCKGEALWFKKTDHQHQPPEVLSRTYFAWGHRWTVYVSSEKWHSALLQLCRLHTNRTVSKPQAWKCEAIAEPSGHLGHHEHFCPEQTATLYLGEYACTFFSL